MTCPYEAPGLGDADHDSKRALIPHCLSLDPRSPSAKDVGERLPWLFAVKTPQLFMSR